MTISPATAEVVVATASGSTSDAASAMVVQRSRAWGVRRSSEQGEQQPAERRGSHGDADDLAGRDGLDVAGVEAEGHVDAQQGDFDPGESSGECAARGAQRAALLDARHGGRRWRANNM